MKRVTLYSSSRSSMTGRATPATQPDQLKSPDPTRESSPAQASGQPPRFPFRNFFERHKPLLWVTAGGLFALLARLGVTEDWPALVRSAARDGWDGHIGAERGTFG